MRGNVDASTAAEELASHVPGKRRTAGKEADACNKEDLDPASTSTPLGHHHRHGPKPPSSAKGHTHHCRSYSAQCHIAGDDAFLLPTPAATRRGPGSVPPATPLASRFSVDTDAVAPASAAAGASAGASTPPVPTPAQATPSVAAPATAPPAVGVTPTTAPPPAPRTASRWQAADSGERSGGGSPVASDASGTAAARAAVRAAMSLSGRSASPLRTPSEGTASERSATAAALLLLPAKLRSKAQRGGSAPPQQPPPAAAAPAAEGAEAGVTHGRGGVEPTAVEGAEVGMGRAESFDLMLLAAAAAEGTPPAKQQHQRPAQPSALPEAAAGVAPLRSGQQQRVRGAERQCGLGAAAGAPAAPTVRLGPLTCLHVHVTNGKQQQQQQQQQHQAHQQQPAALRQDVPAPAAGHATPAQRRMHPGQQLHQLQHQQQLQQQILRGPPSSGGRGAVAGNALPSPVLARAHVHAGPRRRSVDSSSGPPSPADAPAPALEPAPRPRQAQRRGWEAEGREPSQEAQRHWRKAGSVGSGAPGCVPYDPQLVPSLFKAPLPKAPVVAAQQQQPPQQPPPPPPPPQQQQHQQAVETPLARAAASAIATAAASVAASAPPPPPPLPIAGLSAPPAASAEQCWRLALSQPWIIGMEVQRANAVLQSAREAAVAAAATQQRLPQQAAGVGAAAGGAKRSAAAAGLGGFARGGRKAVRWA
ncbi:hypothetical protein MNEG_10202 [Monoraphidium neglectum]|uniref:Uncharacterized protein n=1 Tax=Monoraphidium neglectum TaxID=145388 RepID=A0A0D2M287_9CHLO|nr:hypothetical protein MNEG_10202 [Monoraphidium neglectum]KIY97759.1 hypothetical protein MNEG_10202 [Monoraphidium neglectum]|eukprot:XP_013896779.1 hypothetical protein MNEG_10202 [Monoraphidium neglectum]